jgi:iron-sulfur cluster assembly protein
MITISDKALEVLRRQGAENGVVRIVVKSGGCAGMTYDAMIAPEAEKGEETVYQDGGIEVVTDSASKPFLQGLQVDYSDDLISAGFRFNNNSNESSCGCGASFTVSGFPQMIKEGVGCGS